MGLCLARAHALQWKGSKTACAHNVPHQGIRPQCPQGSHTRQPGTSAAGTWRFKQPGQGVVCSFLGVGQPPQDPQKLRDLLCQPPWLRAKGATGLLAAWAGQLTPSIAMACHSPSLMVYGDVPGSSGSVYAVAWQMRGLVLGSRCWQCWDWRACSPMGTTAWCPATSIPSPDRILVHAVKQHP